MMLAWLLWVPEQVPLETKITAQSQGRLTYYREVTIRLNGEILKCYEGSLGATTDCPNTSLIQKNIGNLCVAHLSAIKNRYDIQQNLLISLNCNVDGVSQEIYSKHQLYLVRIGAAKSDIWIGLIFWLLICGFMFYRELKQ